MSYQNQSLTEHVICHDRQSEPNCPYCQLREERNLKGQTGKQGA